MKCDATNQVYKRIDLVMAVTAATWAARNDKTPIDIREVNFKVVTIFSGVDDDAATSAGEISFSEDR